MWYNNADACVHQSLTHLGKSMREMERGGERDTEGKKEKDKKERKEINGDKGNE